MRKFRKGNVLLTFLLFYLFTFTFLSCGTENGRFRIKGHLQNMNQAEFYIYSPDAGFMKVDTIRVDKGSFVYETSLEKLATYILIYPNSSEQVVFGNSGATVEMEGDASHLKEMEVKGTEENEQMTAWRMNANRLTPPEVKQSAIDFIKEHPGSIVSNYLFQRYVMLDEEPDYRAAAALAKLMLKEQPENGRLIRLEKQLRGLQYFTKGAILPNFKATDINGNAVGRQSLHAELNIVSVWAMWNYDSMNMQRKLHRLQREYGSRMALVSISLDPRIKDCKTFVERDSIRWSNICDGKMWDSPLVQELGFSVIPGNILVDRQGKVIDVNVPVTKIEERVKAALEREKPQASLGASEREPSRL